MMEIKNYISQKTSLNEIVENLINKRDYLDKMILRNQSRLIQRGQYIITEGHSEKVFPVETIKLKATNIPELIKEYYEIMNRVMREGNTSVNNEYMDMVYFKDSVHDFTHIDATLYICLNKPTNYSQSFQLKKYIKTYYRGPYEHMDSAYQALVAYANEHQLALTGDSIESYKESFQLYSNPNDFLTELYMIVE